MKKTLFFISVILLLIHPSCTSSKKAKITQEEMRARAEAPIEKTLKLECDYSGTVHLSDDPKCGVLLNLPNGISFQPIRLPDSLDFTFQNGQHIRFSYHVLEDVATLCTRAMGAADITCLVKDLNVSTKKEAICSDVIDVFKVHWMEDVLKTMDARKVSKLIYKEEPAYKFESRTATLLFDCHGNELCRIRPGEKEDCMVFLSQMSNEYVILVVNE